MTGELFRLTALEAVDLLRRREVSAVDLVEVAAARIEAVDGALNALPTRCVERALAHARRLEGARWPEDEPGWLGGLPVAIKDLNDVAGVRSTQGSPIYADHVPTRSDVLVERLEGRGAIVIAKSNTPEFGAGASTFNPVFGKTRNPWNTAKSVAGSSGGAAAALASGQVWLAQGSDLGGSLRTPASFCGVVGLRPCPGRVPHGPATLPFQTMSVNGPMARTAADCALFLDAMAGPHPEDPLSFDAPAESFLARSRTLPPPRRVAFSPDLGIVPVDPEVAAICAAAAHRFADLGAAVEQACPDFANAIETFQTLRAAEFAARLAPTLESHRDQLKPEVVWNIETGLALGAADISRAERHRGALFHAAQAFFADHDLLLCPAAIVPPFDVDVRYVEEVAGQRFDNYVHWIAITFVLTLTGLPVIAVPAGHTREGLPVGLQIVGPPRGEAKVLAAAAQLEAATGFARRLPIDPRPPTEPAVSET
jgi:amidase